MILKKAIQNKHNSIDGKIPTSLNSSSIQLQSDLKTEKREIVREREKAWQYEWDIDCKILI